MRLIALLSAAMLSVAPVAAQTAAPVTIYQDARVLCGNERAAPYQVRLQLATKEKAKHLRAMGHEVRIVRIGAYDQMPVVNGVNTYRVYLADC